MIEQVFTFSDGIQCVHAAAEGLWIGHHGGASFFAPQSGLHVKWTCADGLPAHPVLHVASWGTRLALATPNGIGWTDDRRQFTEEPASASARPAWKRGLAHARGAGVYVNGVEFVEGRIHAATGGGRIYLEGENGFQLLELPLRQARLLRLLALQEPPQALRLLLVSNNSGILLLATGKGEEPSLYQWSEQEGLCSRYVTSVASAGEYVAAGVHGCIHVARLQDLIARPDDLTRWGRITLSDVQGPVEHNRIHALCVHGEHLYAGTSAGLFRVPVVELAIAVEDRVAAQRLEERPVRHLASFGGELWAVQHAGLGRVLEGGATRPSRLEGAGERVEARPSFAGYPEGAFRRTEPAPVVPRITSFGRRWRFVPEPRWRGSNAEPESQRIVCLASTPDGLAFGGESGRVGLHTRGRWVTESLARQRRFPEVHSLVHDPESARLWAATRHGLFHRDARGRWWRDFAFPGRIVHQLLVWRNSLVAIGSAGLHVYVQSNWSEVPIQGQMPALFLAGAGEAGLLLAGRPGAGYHIWRPGAAEPEPYPLPAGRGNCLSWDAAGRLWVGTDRGLVAWDGEQARVLRWSNDSENHVTALLVHEGTVHVGSHAGLWIAPLADLLQRDPGQLEDEILEERGRRLGLLEGLPNPHVSSIVVHAGRVWVGTQSGLALLAPP